MTKYKTSNWLKQKSKFVGSHNSTIPTSRTSLKLGWIQGFTLVIRPGLLHRLALTSLVLASHREVLFAWWPGVALGFHSISLATPFISLQQELWNDTCCLDGVTCKLRKDGLRG